MTHRSYREESRKDWGTSSDSALSIEQINSGAILRIADAVEKMARNYSDLIDDRNWQKERADRSLARADKLERSNAALRGHLKRAKAGVAK